MIRYPVFCNYHFYFLITLDLEKILLDMQVIPGDKVSAPFLILNEKRRLMLLPLFPSHNEAHDPSNTTLCELSHASMEAEFPTEKWVHCGCEVCTSTD